jgi:hypothetical protein
MTFVFLSASYLYSANNFILHNRTQTPVYYAFYATRDNPLFNSKIMSPPQMLAPRATHSTNAPEMDLLDRAEILCSPNKKLFKPILTKYEHENIAQFSVAQILNYDMSYEENAHYDLSHYPTPYSPKKAVAKNLFILRDSDNTLNLSLESFIRSPKPRKTAFAEVQVRKGNGIPPQEEEFLSKRIPHVRHALEKIIGPLPGDKTPNIAILGSGGGYRALIGFMGVLLGLQEIGLWDACTYAAGVSGSTWLLSAVYGKHMSLDKVRKDLRKRLATDLRRPLLSPVALLSPTEKLFFTNKKYVKLRDRKKDFTLVDMWGALISNALFGHEDNLGFNVVLSKIADRVKDGEMPLYMSTAVVPGLKGHPWFEYTPYEVGSADFGAFIPARYAGAEFYNGYLVEKNFKEYPLGLHCGVFGSAFAVSINRIGKELKSPWFDAIVKNTNLKHSQITTGLLTNFMRGMDRSAFSRSDNLRLVDAGQDLNIPLPPLLHRHPNILIVANIFDQPKGDKTSILDQAVEDAKKRGYKMPLIIRDGIHSRPITVLEDPMDPSVPTIIYIPNLYANFATTKFEYTWEEFEQLCAAMKQAVVDNKELFYDVCKKVSYSINEAIFSPDSISPLRPSSPAEQSSPFRGSSPTRSSSPAGPSSPQQSLGRLHTLSSSSIKLQENQLLMAFFNLCFGAMKDKKDTDFIAHKNLIETSAQTVSKNTQLANWKLITRKYFEQFDRGSEELFNKIRWLRDQCFIAGSTKAVRLLQQYLREENQPLFVFDECQVPSTLFASKYVAYHKETLDSNARSSGYLCKYLIDMQPQKTSTDLGKIDALLLRHSPADNCTKTLLKTVELAYFYNKNTTQPFFDYYLSLANRAARSMRGIKQASMCVIAYVLSREFFSIKKEIQHICTDRQIIFEAQKMFAQLRQHGRTFEEARSQIILFVEGIAQQMPASSSGASSSSSSDNFY